MISAVLAAHGWASKLHFHPLRQGFLDEWPSTDGGYVRPPFVVSDIRLAYPQPLGRSQLPAKFDWRQYQKVTSVKDQGICNACWVFAVAAALESRALISEQHSWDVSEAEALVCQDPAWVLFHRDRCQAGGWPIMAADVLAKRGIKDEVCAPYDPQTLNYQSCPSTCRSLGRLNSYRVITMDPSRDMYFVKSAIVAHGPVLMAYHHREDRLYGSSVYFYPNCLDPPNHVVTVVGWDDELVHPDGKGKGAWIAKNSWGEDWGQEGYFYLCYGSGNQQETSLLDYESASWPVDLYYYDQAGPLTFSGYEGQDFIWVALVYSLATDGELLKVELWTPGTTEYKLQVYRGKFGPIAVQQEGVLEGMGYHSIPLSTPVPLRAAQDFTVVMMLRTPGFTYPLAVEKRFPGLCEPPIERGVTFVRPNESAQWEDLSLWDSNPCIRAVVLRKGSGLVTVSAYSRQGVLLSQRQLDLPAGGRWVGFVESLFDGRLPQGTAWLRVESSDSISGYIVYGRKDGRSAASVPAMASALTEVNLLHVPSDPWWTGVVILNPNDQDVDVYVSCYSDVGQVLSEVTMRLPGRNNWVGFLKVLFGGKLPDSCGWVKLRSGMPVIAFELLGMDEQIISIAPTNTQTASVLYIPHIALDSEWWTGIVLLRSP